MTPAENRLTRRRLFALGGTAAAGLVAGRVPSAKASQRSPAAGVAATRSRFATEPTWNPPPVTVTTPADGAAPGSIFVTPTIFGSTDAPPGAHGPLILDDEGEPIWFHPLSTAIAQNLRVQRYHRGRVLTWYEGPAGGTYGGNFVVYDSAYRQLLRVQAGNGYKCDLHEFLITWRGTALLTIYNELKADLTSVGGGADDRLVEGIVQEIDLASKRVLLEWHSLDHVGVDESYRTDVTPAGNVDYFHLNSIGIDQSGDLLVSARHTSTVYRVDRKTGAVIWRLGGEKNDFQMGPGAAFNFQHDVRSHPDGTLTLFDNGSADTGAHKIEPASRPMRLALDLDAMTAELVQVYETPDPRLGIALGNVQQLPDDGVFVNWGTAGSFSEFTSDGTVRFDARFGDKSVSYRALRFPWVGRPTDPPKGAVEPNADGTLTVYASWNGATEVARWQVRSGAAADRMKTVQTKSRTGFETAIVVPALTGYVSVVALDADGKVLGTSALLEV